MTQLTEHFTLEELIRSEIALRKGWDNTPTDGAIDNLKRLAVTLEEIRKILNLPMIITSGYRSKLVNDAVGSHDNSHHRYGLAADFIVPGIKSVNGLNWIMSEIIKSNIEYDQLIKEFDSWIHVSIADTEPARKQALVINKDGVKLFNAS